MNDKTKSANAFLKCATELYENVPIQIDEMKVIDEDGVERYKTFKEVNPNPRYSLDKSMVCFALPMKEEASLDQMEQLAIGYGVSFGKGVKNADKDIAYIFWVNIQELLSLPEWSSNDNEQE